ncbi:hypothetical protein [Parasedimentitalea marina]|nr:hypothetical protein [Parasedimentitalea marina]
MKRVDTMNDTQVTLFNTGLPMMVIGILAVVVPRLLVQKATRSHLVVAIGMILACVTMAVLSAGVFFLFDNRSYETLIGAGGYVLALEFLIEASWKAVILWAPLILLTWLSLAQRVERLRGQDLAERNSL